MSPLGDPADGASNQTGTAPYETSTETSVTHKECAEEGGASSNIEARPNRASVLFAVALFLTSAIVAGSVLFAALASPA
jgi:hypothetical protein